MVCGLKVWMRHVIYCVWKAENFFVSVPFQYKSSWLWAIESFSISVLSLCNLQSLPTFPLFPTMSQAACPCSSWNTSCDTILLDGLFMECSGGWQTANGNFCWTLCPSFLSSLTYTSRVCSICIPFWRFSILSRFHQTGHWGCIYCLYQTAFTLTCHTHRAAQEWSSHLLCMKYTVFSTKLDTEDSSPPTS